MTDEKAPSIQVWTVGPSTSSARSVKDVECAGPSRKWPTWQHMKQDVDPEESTLPLATFYFMSGYIDAVCFSATYVWCGFQSGNFTQLSIAIARLWEGRDNSFHIADRQALCSLLSFWVGVLLGRIGGRLGHHKRAWLIMGNLLTVFFTMLAALAIWRSGQPSVSTERDLPAWSNAVAFVGISALSIACGLQGSIAKNLGSQFGTTLVLTSLWVELFSDPGLFRPRRVVSRDHRIIGVFAIFVGAFIGRAMVFEIGAAGTIGVGVGIRLLATCCWFCIPSKQSASI